MVQVRRKETESRDVRLDHPQKKEEERGGGPAAQEGKGLGGGVEDDLPGLLPEGDGADVELLDGIDGPYQDRGTAPVSCALLSHSNRGKNK